MTGEPVGHLAAFDALAELAAHVLGKASGVDGDGPGNANGHAGADGVSAALSVEVGPRRGGCVVVPVLGEVVGEPVAQFVGVGSVALGVLGDDGDCLGDARPLACGVPNGGSARSVWANITRRTWAASVSALRCRARRAGRLNA